MIVSAGLFLIRKDYNVLVCHPTKMKKTVWSIPKGKVEVGEHYIDAAVRETLEETNANLSNWSIIHNLTPMVYPNGKKVLHGYALFESQNRINFDDFELKCNSNVPEDKGGYPEMDDYKWVTIDEARYLLHITQVNCLNEIETIIDKITKEKPK